MKIYTSRGWIIKGKNYIDILSPIDKDYIDGYDWYYNIEEDRCIGIRRTDNKKTFTRVKYLNAIWGFLVH